MIIKKKNNSKFKLQEETWMQCENPALSTEECIEQLGEVLEVGSRYYFKLGKAKEGFTQRESSKLVPAWGKNLESAEEYMGKHYPGFKYEYIGMDLENRCFKVYERSDATQALQKKQREVYKCKHCSAFSGDIDQIITHEKKHENT